MPSGPLPESVLRQPALEGQEDEVGAAAHAEFVEQIGNVKLYGALGDIQLAGDLLVREVFQKRIQDFLLAAAEICDGIGLEPAPLASENGIHKSGEKLPRHPKSAVGHQW